MFKDHFSSQSNAYQKYRPDYPHELFDWLAGQAPENRLAVVVATEPSAAQLRESRSDPRIEYRLESAEAISLPPASVDLIVAAQAAHWFDWPRFCDEAARVLRSGGIVAVWSYGNCLVDPDIDRLVADFSRDVVGPYWPRERRHVDEGYRDLMLPFAPVDSPAFEMRTLYTWSAVRRCRARTGRDPLELLAAPLAEAWGDAPRRVRWPLSMKAGRA